MKIDYALPNLNTQQAGLYGLEHQRAPLQDTPSSLIGGWSLNEPLSRFFLAGYFLKMLTVPKTSDLPLGAYEQEEDNIIVPFGSYLLGFSGASAQSAGARFSVYDIGMKTFAITDEWDNFNTGAGLPSDADNQYLILSTPYLVLEPGLLQVRVANLASVSADLQLLLFFACPGGSQ